MNCDELIAALKQAEQGSGVLDREIARLCKIEWSSDEDGNFGGHNMLPRRCWFTRTIDAALTLVPDGWHWSVGSDGSNLHQFRAGLSKLTSGGWDDRHGVSKSPAIALCIAALKARTR